MVCEQAACAGPLTYAEELYAAEENVVAGVLTGAAAAATAQPADADGPAAGTESSEESVCECTTPEPSSSRSGHCWVCGDSLRPGAGVEDLPPVAHPETGASPAADPTPTSRRKAAVLQWPTGAQVGIAAGLLVGREVHCTSLTLGRAMQDCTTLSRVHAWLSWSEAGLTVVDLASRNGTWVDGERLPPGLPRLISAHRMPGAGLTIAFGPSLVSQVILVETS